MHPVTGSIRGSLWMLMVHPAPLYGGYYFFNGRVVPYHKVKSMDRLVLLQFFIET